MSCRITKGNERLARNRDWLYQKYWKEEMSTREIGRSIGLNEGTITYWMKKLGISARHINFNSGEKAWNWKGGQNHKTVAKYAKLLLGEKCQRCGNDKGKISIHHKDGDRKNNSLFNLMILCHPCHMIIHKENPNPLDGRRLRLNFLPRDRLGRFTKEV